MATIRLLHDDGAPPRTGALIAFTERTGHTVELTPLPAARPRHELREGCAGEAAWDLLLLDEVDVADLLRRGLLEMLGRRAHHGRLDLDDFPQAAIDRFRAADMVYAVPYRAHANVLIYRPDLFARYGFSVPRSWEALRETAAALFLALRADGHDDIAGFVARAAAGYDRNFWITGSTLFPSWGWHWNRGPGQPPRLHAPETVDALETFAAMVRESGPPDAAKLTVADARRRFAEGRAATLIDTAGAFAEIARAWPNDADARPAIALVPTGPSGRPEPGLAAPALCIPAASPRADEAWELLRHLVSPLEQIVDAVEGAGPEPARASALESAAVRAAYSDEVRAVLQRTRAHARINRPLLPFGRELGDLAGAAIQSVLTGERTAADSLRRAQTEIDAMSWLP